MVGLGIALHLVAVVEPGRSLSYIQAILRGKYCNIAQRADGAFRAL